MNIVELNERVRDCQQARWREQGRAESTAKLFLGGSLLGIVAGVAILQSPEMIAAAATLGLISTGKMFYHHYLQGKAFSNEGGVTLFERAPPELLDLVTEQVRDALAAGDRSFCGESVLAKCYAQSYAGALEREFSPDPVMSHQAKQDIAAMFCRHAMVVGQAFVNSGEGNPQWMRDSAKLFATLAPFYGDAKTVVELLGGPLNKPVVSTFKLIDEDEWNRVDVRDAGHPYIHFAQKWGELMQFEIERNGKTVAEVADLTARMADVGSITGFAYAEAVDLLSKTWEYGEEFKAWHRAAWHIDGTEPSSFNSGNRLAAM